MLVSRLGQTSVDRRMLLLLGAVLLLFFTLLWLRWPFEHGEGRIVVVVLGDMGRSPRMQYHCVSLLKAGYSVEFIGYGGRFCIVNMTDSQQFMHLS